MNIKHTAESWRRISCEAAAAAGTDTSPEEGSDRSTYKVCSLKDETGCRLEGKLCTTPGAGSVKQMPYLFIAKLLTANSFPAMIFFSSVND